MRGVWLVAGVLAARCLVQSDPGSDLLEELPIALQLIRCALRTLRLSMLRVSPPEQRPQGLQRHGDHAGTAAKCSCTKRTTMAPSPTAVAQRLTEPERTSPAA